MARRMFSRFKVLLKAISVFRAFEYYYLFFRVVWGGRHYSEVSQVVLISNNRSVLLESIYNFHFLVPAFVDLLVNDDGMNCEVRHDDYTTIGARIAGSNEAGGGDMVRSKWE